MSAGSLRDAPLLVLYACAAHVVGLWTACHWTFSRPSFSCTLYLSRGSVMRSMSGGEWAASVAALHISNLYNPYL